MESLPRRESAGPNPPQEGRLHAQSVRRQEQYLIRLAGEIDLGTVSVLYEAIHTCLGTRPGIVVISLDGVSFCDCAGLRALLQARLEIVQAGGECHVQGPLQPAVASLIGHTRTAAGLGMHEHEASDGQHGGPPTA